MFPKIIAEIGCNHKGSIDVAEKMIEVAGKYCKVDVVKFQKRTVKDLLTDEEYLAPHPVPNNSYGNTYGEHREFLEFTLDQHKYLKEVCLKNNVDYSASVWDVNAAKEITSLKPKSIKIPSACNLKIDILDFLAKNYSGEIHISLGMTTRAEERRIINFMADRGRANDLVVYSCTSGYPVPFEDVCLLEIGRLREHWKKGCLGVGFSGHHLGIAIDMGAITLGAEYVERHFTLDRTWKGTDHAASLEPDGLRKLVRDSKAVSKALRFKNDEILEIEAEQRLKLKRL